MSTLAEISARPSRRKVDRQIERNRLLKAKEEIVVEAAMAWVDTCEEDGAIAEEAEANLVDACEGLKVARRGKRPPPKVGP